jgi:Zn-dependent oligopeptidase
MSTRAEMAARIEEKANEKLKQKAASADINVQDIRSSLKNALIVELAYEMYNKKLRQRAEQIVEHLDDWDIRFIFESKREHPYAKSLDICRKVLEEKKIHFSILDKILSRIGLRRG